MKQYFSNEKFIDDEKEIKYHDDEFQLKFKTNSGMFSKEHIDSYSIALVKEIPNQEYQNILDLGCGYGFIGIYLSKKFNIPATFIDVTTRACEYTKINCQLNGIKDYQVIESDGILIDDTFDLITLNPPIHAGKEVVYNLIDDAMNHLNKLGNLYIVVHKNHGAKSMINDLKNKDYQVEVVSKRKSLYILKVQN